MLEAKRAKNQRQADAAPFSTEGANKDRANKSTPETNDDTGETSKARSTTTPDKRTWEREEGRRQVAAPSRRRVPHSKPKLV